MKIKGFVKGKGDYIICRYVVGWKSGKYFHKRVCFEKCKYEKYYLDDNDNYFIIMSDGSTTYQLENVHHNVEILQQFNTLEELMKAYQNYKNYNEY